MIEYVILAAALALVFALWLGYTGFRKIRRRERDDEEAERKALLAEYEPKPLPLPAVPGAKATLDDLLDGVKLGDFEMEGDIVIVLKKGTPVTLAGKEGTIRRGYIRLVKGKGQAKPEAGAPAVADGDFAGFAAMFQDV